MSNFKQYMAEQAQKEGAKLVKQKPVKKPEQSMTERLMNSKKIYSRSGGKY